MLAIAASSVAPNSSGLCWAVSPSVRAREKLATTPGHTGGRRRPTTPHPRVLRVVALSGGYSRADANARLARQPGVVASFSRALTEGLTAQQSPEAVSYTHLTLPTK